MIYADDGYGLGTWIAGHGFKRFHWDLSLCGFILRLGGNRWGGGSLVLDMVMINEK